MKSYQKIIAGLMTAMLIFVTPMQCLAADLSGDTVAGASNELLDMTGDAVDSLDTSEGTTTENTGVKSPAATIETEVQSISQVLEYAYVESSSIVQTNIQNVLVSLVDKNTVVDSANIWYQQDDGEVLFADMVNSTEGALLFNPKTEKLGEYHIIKMMYTSNGMEYSVDFSKEGIEAKYTVLTEDEWKKLDKADTEKAGENMETTIEVVDKDGRTTEVGSLEDGLAAAEKNASEAAEASGIDSNVVSQTAAMSLDAAPRTQSNVVVVLDPGHDMVNTGAHGYISEEEYTLLIAQACSNELQQYNGISVYMTRTAGNTSFVNSEGKEDLYSRDDWAKSLGANLFVSFHLNAATAAATGAEIYISTYSGHSGMTTSIANQILVQLAAMGLPNRGVKTNTDDRTDTYEDGNTKDAFIVIRENTQQGISAMLLEQGFVTNSSDANIIANQYTRIGQVDATAIANYFGLSKGPFYYSPGNGIAMGQSLELKTSPLYMGGYSQSFRYIYRNINSNQWNYTESTTKTTHNWTPTEPGTYWVGVEGKSSTGSTQNFFAASPVVIRDYEYGVDSIAYLDHGKTIDFGAAYHSSSKNTQFKFQIYDLQKEQWTDICDWYSGNWVTWTPPHSGTYWVHVEMKIAEKSEISSLTIPYQVTLPEDQANITGICAIDQGNSIDVGAAYTSDASNLEFQWQIYNLAKQKWSVISDWDKGNWATWIPQESGTYWLHVEARSGNRTLSTYTIAYQITMQEPTASISGIAVINHADTIDVGAAYTSSSPNVQFRWQSYDLSAQKWTVIRDWEKGNWATWTPASSGTYWLHVEARIGEAVLSTFTIPFQVTLQRETAQVNGISVVARGSQVDMGAAYTTTAANPKFQWKVYNLQTKNWEEVSDWTSSNWVTWRPESIGSYWIYVAVKGNTSVLTDFSIGYVVSTLGYKIMGMSNSSVTQMVQYYMANTKGYDTFPKYGTAYNGILSKGGAPNITVFCNMYWQEAVAEGVKPEVAFVQAMKETGFLKYGGDVIPSQYNFAGIGTTGGGVKGAQFTDVREGIRAQIQHLKAYASTENLNYAQVDPRFHLVPRGVATTVEELAGKWATSLTYGTDLVQQLYSLRVYTL